MIRSRRRCCLMNRNEIHSEMLEDINGDYDKRLGSFIYDATKPAAIQLEKAYQKNDEVKQKLDIENLFGEELAKRIKERTGIERRKATYAIGSLTVEGNGTINTGDIFETESGIQFEATETVIISSSGRVNIKAIEPGETGNIPSNQITFMPVTLDNINDTTNPQATYDGFNAETDEDLLQRYYDRIRTPATSGNKYHYLNWAKSISGIGDARVFPLWDGDNTVKVVVINSDREPASNELVSEVQGYIDPNVTGLGDGIAPIGAFCTVESAAGVDINVSFSGVLEDGYSAEDVTLDVSQRLTDYLREIAFNQDYVSYAQVGSILINTNGVSDYADLTINNGTENILIAADQVAVLGVVNLV